MDARMPSQPTEKSAMPPKASFGEFVALCALLQAAQALGVDTMLPALGTIGRELHVLNANHTQWIIAAYVIGLGVGQLLWGVLSDRFGRRNILIWGLFFYIGLALACATATDFGVLLWLRAAHGFAAASMVVARSMIRDLYEGRRMARVSSLTFIVFIIVPIVAPSLGQWFLSLFEWPMIFVLFGGFGVVLLVWIWFRLRETLPVDRRFTLTTTHLVHAATRVLGDRSAICYTLGITLLFGCVMAYVSTMQQLFTELFRRPQLMPTVFAGCAAGMGVMALLNSYIVERIGMRIISQLALLLCIGFTAVHVLVAASGRESLMSFVLLQAAALACNGLISANFNAMAMEPMGAVAGAAASLQGCISTGGGALLAMLVGHYFDGTSLPLVAGSLACMLMALVLVLIAEKGRLFRPHHPAPAQALP
jgi:MFS transporter, DHA1 family, multidrug resistance protein